MSFFSKVRDYQKTYGFFKAFKVILNRKKQSLKAKEDMNKNISLLDEKYSHLLKDFTYAPEKKEIPKVFYFFWYDGISSLPKICSMCLLKLKRLYPDYKIVFIDKKYISDMEEINPLYLKLLDEKKITIQFFSDLLRWTLLSSRGGVWIDSTVYLAKRLEINSNSADGFFTLNTKNHSSFLSYKGKSCCYSSFFIATSENHPLAQAMLKLFDSYLLDNDGNDIYFLIDIFLMFCLIYRVGDSCMDRFKDSFSLDYNCYFLSENLSKKADDESLSYLDRGPMKLNWRIDIDKYMETTIIRKIYKEAVK